MENYLNILYNKTQKLDLYLPKNKGFKTIIYFHGGGLECGNKDDTNYVEMAEDFKKHGFAFASVEYGLYPNTKFPKYLEQCAESVYFIESKIKEYGGNGQIIISGQSAGAWITLMLCLNKKLLSNAKVDESKIKGYIIDSAQTTAHFNVIKYELNEDSRKQMINEYAPLYYLDKDSDVKKMLLIAYKEDMPCRLEQNKLFFRAVKTFNKDADIEFIELKGGHCRASSEKDKDGRYGFAKRAIFWLKKKFYQTNNK